MIEASIIQAIKAAPSLAELTAVRVTLLQADKPPHAKVKLYSSRHDIANDGETNVAYTGLQIDVTVSGKEAALKSRQLARAVQKLFNGFKGDLHGTEVYRIEAAILQGTDDLVRESSDEWVYTSHIDLQIIHDEE